MESKLVLIGGKFPQQKPRISDRPEVQERLSYLRSLLMGDGTNEPILLSCVYVKSAHNVADVPSRDEGDIDMRIDWSNHPDSVQSDAETRWVSAVTLLQVAVQEVSLEAVLQGRLVI